ncbi:MAG TPA: hypothetical protein VM121_00635 [Acidimicrobiales bacterium]|nr:hypothetical protein [Acidimicrobiales bacterium]
MASTVSRRRGRLLTVLALLSVMAVSATPVNAGNTFSPFQTSQPPMLTNLAGGTVEPILTVGDQVGNYLFEALPDGISVIARNSTTLDLLVNHETSTVPFPYSNPPSASNLNDFSDSLVSVLRVKRSNRDVIRARYVIHHANNFHRLCSNYLARGVNGFDRPILFTNEEGTDWVNKAGLQWPATVGDNSARQIGYVVARDLTNGVTKPIYGMGRHNHENSLALKGFGKPVVLSGDDTFTTNPPHSQVYSYIANNRAAVMNDTGTLYAFVADDPAINDYYDFPVGSTMSISGTYIPVPKEIATGLNPDGTDMVASEVPVSVGGPYPAPVAGEMTNSAGTSTPVDGPQWILEHWSDLNNVFQFVRIEDMAYDKRPNMGNTVYLADSGRGSTSAPGPGVSTNGRIWKMVFDPNNPTVVTSLSILVEGDDSAVKTLTEVRQPDNLETTRNGLYITEDTGSSQQFAPGDPLGANARVWQYNLTTTALTPVLEVDQTADEGPTDVDSAAVAGNMGAWEASGIVDVSKWFGPGYFMIDVQAHTLFTHTQPGPNIDTASTGPDWTYKREGGQLLLIRIPGG